MPKETEVVVISEPTAALLGQGRYAGIVTAHGFQFACIYASGGRYVHSVSGRGMHSARPTWQLDRARQAVERWFKATIRKMPESFHEAHRDYYGLDQAA